MAFPGLDTLRPFLSDICVGPHTRARHWLVCLECDVRTVEELLTEPRYSVYPARRCAQEMVFLVLEWDCTSIRLETVFGAPLLVRVAKEDSVQQLKDFLRGAKGTNVEEWSTVFPTVKKRFNLGLLNEFAMDLNIDCRDKLVALYCRLPRLFDPEFCHRMKISITEQDAERLFREHHANSIAFMGDSRQSQFAKVAIQTQELNSMHD